MVLITITEAALQEIMLQDCLVPQQNCTLFQWEGMQFHNQNSPTVFSNNNSRLQTP
jgi:hypothetical protein